MYLGRLGKEENGRNTFDILSLKWGYYSRGNVEREARGTHSFLGLGERSKDIKRDLVLGDTCMVVTGEAIRIGGFSRV